MIIVENLFKKGIGFRSYIFNLGESHKHSLMKYYIPVTINDDIKKKVYAIDKKINILGVLYPLCLDCNLNLPLIEKIISTNSNIVLRLVLKDAVKDELDDFLVDDKLKIPTFIFMDEDFNVLGSFIEKPKVVKDETLTGAERQNISEKYKSGQLVEEIADEILSIMNK